MAFTAGTASVVTTTAPAGANYAFVLSQYLVSAELDFAQPELDVTVLSDTDRNFVQGFKEQTFTFTGIWDPTVDNNLNGMRGGTIAPTRYYPQGSATGSIYYQFNFRLLDYNVPTDLNSAVTYSCRGRASSITRGTA